MANTFTFPEPKEPLLQGSPALGLALLDASADIPRAVREDDESRLLAATSAVYFETMEILKEVGEEVPLTVSVEDLSGEDAFEKRRTSLAVLLNSCNFYVCKMSPPRRPTDLPNIATTLLKNLGSLVALYFSEDTFSKAYDEYRSTLKEGCL